jgi:hypothetical protein
MATVIYLVGLAAHEYFCPVQSFADEDKALKYAAYCEAKKGLLVFGSYIVWNVQHDGSVEGDEQAEFVSLSAPEDLPQEGDPGFKPETSGAYGEGFTPSEGRAEEGESEGTGSGFKGVKTVDAVHVTINERIR